MHIDDPTMQVRIWPATWLGLTPYLAEGQKVVRREQDSEAESSMLPRSSTPLIINEQKPIDDRSDRDSARLGVESLHSHRFILCYVMT